MILQYCNQGAHRELRRLSLTAYYSINLILFGIAVCLIQYLSAYALLRIRFGYRSSRLLIFQFKLHVQSQLKLNVYNIEYRYINMFTWTLCQYWSDFMCLYKFDSESAACSNSCKTVRNWHKNSLQSHPQVCLQKICNSLQLQYSIQARSDRSRIFWIADS